MPIAWANSTASSRRPTRATTPATTTNSRTSSPADGRGSSGRGSIAFHVDDCRSFISCSQDVPFKIEQGDRRFVVNRTRDKFSPTGVKNGEITQEEFVEFGRKLDRIKNDNEVAYELFAMVMRLDLSGFDKTRLPVTAAKTEQQNETSCRGDGLDRARRQAGVLRPCQPTRGVL